MHDKAVPCLGDWHAGCRPGSAAARAHQSRRRAQPWGVTHLKHSALRQAGQPVVGCQLGGALAVVVCLLVTPGAWTKKGAGCREVQHGLSRGTVVLRGRRPGMRQRHACLVQAQRGSGGKGGAGAACKPTLCAAQHAPASGAALCTAGSAHQMWGGTKLPSRYGRSKVRISLGSVAVEVERIHRSEGSGRSDLACDP